MNRTITLKPSENVIGGNFSDNDIVLVKCDATDEAFSFTMPSAEGLNNVTFIIKKIDSSTNTVTIEFNGDETLDGATSKTLSEQYDSVSVIGDYNVYFEYGAIGSNVIADCLKKDGSTELTGNWDSGNYRITSKYLECETLDIGDSQQINISFDSDDAIFECSGGFKIQSAINIPRDPYAFGFTSPHCALILGDLSGADAGNGGLYSIGRYNKSNEPFSALTGWDSGTKRALYFGGGGYDAPDATEINFYTAPSYVETLNTGILRWKIDSTGDLLGQSDNQNIKLGNANGFKFYDDGTWGHIEQTRGVKFNCAINVPMDPSAFGTSSSQTVLVLGNTTGATAGNGGVVLFARRDKSNSPSNAFAGWDSGSARSLYFGGGGFNTVDATDINFFTAPTYNESLSTGILRWKIDSTGDLLGQSDNQNIRLGSSQQMKLYFDGTDSRVGSTGGLKLNCALNIPRDANAFTTGSPHTALVIGELSGANAGNGGLYCIGRYDKANAPFSGLSGWDSGSVRALYFGGGGYGAPDPTELHFYTAPSYVETVDTGLRRMKIDINGLATFYYGVLLDNNNKINFRDTAIGAYSQADGYLDIFCDTLLRIGDSSAGAPTNYLGISPTGDITFSGSAGFYPVRISQSALPTPDTGELVMWHDTDDGKVYMVYNDTDSGVKQVEMT